MALQVSRATRTMSSPAFHTGWGAVAVGAVGAALLTEYARDEVYDVQMRGGDIVYAGLGSLLALAFIPGRWGRMTAMGMMAGGGLSVASNDYDLL